MRIWVDITNSPHVHFFTNLVQDWQQDHEVIITCRPLANTIDLLKMADLDYNVVGRHYGRNKIKKAIGFLIRIHELYRFLKDRPIDVAISHSSFYSPVVAKMLNARCIYINDNEYADGNRISFLFADTIMVPEYLGYNKIKRQGAKRSKVVWYPGVKEGIYLWNFDQALKQTPQAETTKAKSRKSIYIRPEPWTAQYYTGSRDFMDDSLVNLKKKYKILLLPRSDFQKTYYRGEKFAGITVIENSVDLAAIIADCDLFIGAGGTMTREAAVLGVPTISIYNDHLLEVDKYLIRKGHMIHTSHLSVGGVTEFLNNHTRIRADRELLTKGHQAYQLIKQNVLNLDDSIENNSNQQSCLSHRLNQ